MTLTDVVLTVVTSAVTTVLVSTRGQVLTLLIPRRRPKPVDPEVLARIYSSAARVATGGGQPPGTPPSVPRPPVQ